MAKEQELRFLVTLDGLATIDNFFEKYTTLESLNNISVSHPIYEARSINQGYIGEAPLTTRVRLVEYHRTEKAFLTIKGKKVPNPVTDVPEASEFEYPIPVQDAKELLSMCLGIVKKCRFEIPLEVEETSYTIELDVFTNPELLGLVIAEIELPMGTTLDQSIKLKESLPSWIGLDISETGGYSNFELSKKLKN